MKKMRVSLCEGRHEMPAEIKGSIFPNIVDPTDLASLDSQCHMALRECASLDLYVTGLTVALTTVIRYCIYNAVPLTLYHYDRATGEYYPQTIIAEDDDIVLYRKGLI